MRISKCINCGITPEIVESGDNEYPYLLKHKGPSLCYPTFKLECYGKHKQECIDIWNEFNIPRYFYDHRRFDYVHSKRS